MRRRTLTTLLLAGVAALLVGTLASSTSATSVDQGTLLTIRHSPVGCHLWTLNDSTSLTHLLVLHEGQSFTVENRDNCAHSLVQTSGPTLARTANPSSDEGTEIVPFARGVSVTFAKAGVYTFRTTEDEAYKYGWQDELYGRITRMDSAGPDNGLYLTVRVWPNVTHVTD